MLPAVSQQASDVCTEGLHYNASLDRKCVLWLPYRNGFDYNNMGGILTKFPRGFPRERPYMVGKGIKEVGHFHS